MSLRIWIKPKWNTLKRAVDACLAVATSEHEAARRTEGETSEEHRREAEDYHAARKDLWTELHERENSMKNCSDDSVHGNSAPVQITRLHLPKDVREILIGGLLAVSIAVNIWCALNIRDAGTEQRLQQYNLDWFKTHEFSELKGQVAVNERLITAFGPQQCKK